MLDNEAIALGDMDVAVEQGHHGCALCSTEDFGYFDPSK